MKQRPLAGLTVLVAVAGAIVLGAHPSGEIALSASKATDRAPVTGSGVRGMLHLPDKPCSGVGASATIAGLTKTLPYRVAIPTEPEADSSSISGVYACSTTLTEVDFESGVQLMMDISLEPDDEAGADWMRYFVAHDSVEASIGDVNGYVAAVIDPAKDPSGFALGSVTFVEHGAWVCLVGNHKLSADDLLRIARSMPST